MKNEFRMDKAGLRKVVDMVANPKDLSYKTNLWGLWCVNWNDALAFFSSNGNDDTKAKLKDKWYKDFVRMFE